MVHLRLRVISPADCASQGQEGSFEIRLLLLHGSSWMLAATGRSAARVLAICACWSGGAGLAKLHP
eukprot:scaffold14880_cov91-Isochrysis_galbana.AAC.1